VPYFSEHIPIIVIILAYFSKQACKPQLRLISLSPIWAASKRASSKNRQKNHHFYNILNINNKQFLTFCNI